MAWQWGANVTWNMSDYNASGADDWDDDREEYIFHRNDVFYGFLAAYLLVAILAVFGNFMVILVVQCDRQVESKTNFLLGQLALADLCVGVFCVMQSFMAYLSNWLLGLFLCQMYLYVQALSYVASVLIMVAVCVERYVAIMQPFHTRSVFTTARLRLIVVVVWVVSAAYAAPRLFFARVTSQALRHSAERDTFCHLDTRRFDPDAFDTANLVLLYAAPLLAMAAMYSRMCVELWRSGRRVPAGGIHAGRSAPCTTSTVAPDITPALDADVNTTTSLLMLVSESGCDGHTTLQSRMSCGVETNSLHSSEPGSPLPSPAPQLRRLASLPPPGRITRDSTRPCCSPQSKKRDNRSWNKNCRENRCNKNCRENQSSAATSNSHGTSGKATTSAPSEPQRRVETEPGPLAARRRVVLMLMLVVLSFLLCNLPYHARKMWQARLRSQPYQAASMSFYSKLFTPATFLVMYLNSALNPVLYVTMSRSFRRAMFRRLRLCSRGVTTPLRMCSSCCRKQPKPLPSPLIGRAPSMRHGGFNARPSTRASTLMLQSNAKAQQNGAAGEPVTGV